MRIARYQLRQVICAHAHGLFCSGFAGPLWRIHTPRISDALPKISNVGRRGQNPNMAAVTAMQTVALLSPGDTMLMFALGCVAGFIAFPIVIFLASACIAINGWMT